MPKPLDVVLGDTELEAVGHVWTDCFYECRNGDIVGPIVDDGRSPSFGYVAALGNRANEYWVFEGWSMGGGRERDLVSEVKPPLLWDGQQWRKPAP